MNNDLNQVTTILRHQGYDGVVRNPSASDTIVAGVYVKEDRIDFIVGCLNNQNLDLFLGEEVPRTHNEEPKKRAHSYFPRENREPKEFVAAAARHLASTIARIDYLVIACFGSFHSLKYREAEPVDENTYGCLNAVPQYTGWKHVSLYLAFKEAFAQKKAQPKIKVCTDVDAAAFGEYWADPLVSEARVGVERSCVAYLKISRTINVGICANGRPWQGQLHPVAGSIVPRRFQSMRGGKVITDDFAGSCRYHGDCLEGLIGQRALEERTGLNFWNIPRHDILTWELVAYYVASLCVATAALIAPTKIFIGGRIIGEDRDHQAARQLLYKVRGYFYAHTRSIEQRTSHPDGKEIFSPDYPELRDVDNFIKLPEKLQENSHEFESYPRPGRHGAVRMAAKMALDARLST